MSERPTNWRITVKSLPIAYGRLRQAAQHPKTVRYAVSLWVVGHVATTCVVLKEDFLVAAGFLIAYWICRLLQKRAISVQARFIRAVTFVLPNAVAGLDVALTGYLQTWLFQRTGWHIHGWVIAVAVGGFASLVEELADEYERAHRREELASRKLIICPGEKGFLEVENPSHQNLRIVASALDHVAKPNFTVAVLDVNLREVHSVDRDGPLASGEFDLPGGTFQIRVENLSAYPLKIDCHASILTRSEFQKVSNDEIPPKPLLALRRHPRPVCRSRRRQTKACWRISPRLPVAITATSTELWQRLMTGHDKSASRK